VHSFSSPILTGTGLHPVFLTYMQRRF